MLSCRLKSTWAIKYFESIIPKLRNTTIEKLTGD